LYTREFKNKRWKTIKDLAYLMHAVKYSKILNKNLNEQAGSSFWNARMDSGKKTRSCTDPLFSVKLLIEERREVNLETHLAFLDHVKTLTELKEKNCLEYCKTDFPKLLLRSIIEICSAKILIKFNNKI
jgi:hypothetical protein